MSSSLEDLKSELYMICVAENQYNRHDYENSLIRISRAMINVLVDLGEIGFETETMLKIIHTQAREFLEPYIKADEKKFYEEMMLNETEEDTNE